MQFSVEPHRGEDVDEFEDDEPASGRGIASAALRILAAWIARRGGLDRELGAPIDRDFVVARAHA